MTQEAEVLQSSLEGWDKMLQSMEEGGDLTYGFLQLAMRDLLVASHAIRCGYCSRQIASELRLIEITLQLSRLANEWTIGGGVRRKFRVGGTALPLIARIVYLEIRRVF